MRTIINFFKSLFGCSPKLYELIEGDYKKWFQTTGLDRNNVADVSAIERLHRFLIHPEEASSTDLYKRGHYISDSINVFFDSPNDWYFKDDGHCCTLNIKNTGSVTVFQEFASYLETL